MLKAVSVICHTINSADTRGSLTHRHRENNRIANRSAISERAAQGNLSQFSSLDLALPWFAQAMLIDDWRETGN
jgi:hypothetical protein